MTAHPWRLRALVLGLLAIATVATGCSAPAPPPRQAGSVDGAAGPPTDPGPPAGAGDAITDQRTARGAGQAALDYLRLSERAVGLDDGAAAALQREAAASSAADRLVSKLLADLGALRRAYPDGPVTYRVAPLGVRVRPAVGGHVAEVWYVGVLVPHTGSAYEEWRTARYELVWERNAWRVAGEDGEPGPRPAAPAQPAPAPGPALAAVLGEYQPVAASVPAGGRR